MLSCNLVEGLSDQQEPLQEVDDIAATETVFTSNTGTDCSAEGQKYLAGFIAHKLKSKHPELAEDGALDPKVDCPWIDVLSYGGLTRPSTSWLEQFQRFEGEFYNMHSMSISREPLVIQRLEATLKVKFPEVAEDIVKLYAKTRTHIRIKFLKHEFKSSSEQLRNQKKLKHFAN